jgi:flagellin-like hook-associated protein FlgL
MQQLTIQVQGILQNLVKLSGTTSGGRYIFSGDLDQQALYTLDATQPTGVRQLAAPTNTRGITDANGVQIWLGKTASEIFDARNPDTTPASDNVFAAVNSLLTALQNNDSAAAAASIANLKAADSHLNEELGYYGIGQARVNDTLTSISSSLVSVQTEQSNLRDADMAAAAVELQQLTVQQQAALSARAKIGGTNLFDFLA